MMKPPLKLFVLVLAMMGGLLFGACLSAGPVQGSDQPEFQFVPGHILIRFKEGTTARQIDGLLHGLDGTVLRSYQRLNLYHIKIGVNRDVPRALKLVREDPRVAHTQPNYVMRSRSTIPNDPLFPQQWALQNTSQTGGKTGSDIRAPQGWSIVNASSRVVAVIDTGCDYNHEDLAANMWTNPGEIPGNGVDDDGNGFVDDVHGADFVNDDGDPFDDSSSGHGTHVSGIIAAQGSNGIGIAGIAWSIQVMCLKSLNGSGMGTSADAVGAILYAKDKGADLIVAGWGVPGLDLAVNDAILNYGRLVIAAAGNSHLAVLDYPTWSHASNVVAVAATNDEDKRAHFSNFGPDVDIAAPGVDIMSTLPFNGYGLLSGTSMAAAHVTGVAALVRQAFPALTDLQVKNCMINTADPIPDQVFTSHNVGRLNLQRALTECGTDPFATKKTENGFTRIAANGFGDPGNTYTHSAAWFNGKLYVGTLRHFLCVAGRALGTDVPDNVTCPENPLDLDLRAQIWRYTPETDTWEMVFISPIVPIMTEQGLVLVPREISYHSMAVHGGALYVGTQGFAGNLARILKTTDGVSFQVVTQPGLGVTGWQGIRSLASWNGRLYAAPVAAPEDPEEPPTISVVYEVDLVSGVGIPRSQLGFGNLNNRVVFSLDVWNNRLVAGTENSSEGFEVWATDGTPDPADPSRFLWTKLAEKGFYRGPKNLTLVDFGVFNGDLYLGSGRFELVTGEEPVELVGAELIRLKGNGEWDLICGEARDTPDGFKSPTSGLGPGCGDPFDFYIWQIEAHDGNLFISTFDTTTYLTGVNPRGLPPDFVAALIVPRGGFDLFSTSDGDHLSLLTHTGFENEYSYGGRKLVSTPAGLFVGTANPFTNAPDPNKRGAEVWLMRNSP